MKIEITKKVNSHRVNPDYPTLRVWWDSNDTNFMVDDAGANWCPRDKEMLELVQNLMLVSPTFFDKLARVVTVLKRVRA